MIDKFAPIAAIIALFCVVCRFYKWQVSLSLRNESGDMNDYNRICDDVHSLERIATEIESLNEIITDLNVCDDDELKAVKIVIPSALKADEITLLTNGADYSADKLLDIAYSERQQKREQLLQAILDLYSLTSESRNTENVQTQTLTDRKC